MAILRKQRGVTGEIPTSSMADIAFLLLVFFLVTTVFEEEKGLPIVLPEQGQEVEVSQKNVLHLLIQPDGVVQIRRGESPQTQNARFSEIGQIWRLEVAQNENLIAAVKTAPNAQYRHMINVLDELQAAGAERIALQQLEE